METVADPVITDPRIVLAGPGLLGDIIRAHTNRLSFHCRICVNYG